MQYNFVVVGGMGRVTPGRKNERFWQKSKRRGAIGAAA